MSRSAVTNPFSRRSFVRGAAAVGIGVRVAPPLIGLRAAFVVEPAVAGGAGGGPRTTPNTDVIYSDGYVGPIASHKGVVTTERATITVVVPQDVQVGDRSKNAYTQGLEKRTNVHVIYEKLPTTS